MMKISEDISTSTDTGIRSAAPRSVRTPCLICGDTVSIIPYYAGPRICDKCKKAVLSVREKLERNEPFLDTAVSDVCPCNDCEVGWASLSVEGCVGCEDTCEKFAKWMG